MEMALTDFPEFLLCFKIFIPHGINLVLPRPISTVAEIEHYCKGGEAKSLNEVAKQFAAPPVAWRHMLSWVSQVKFGIHMLRRS